MRTVHNVPWVNIKIQIVNKWANVRLVPPENTLRVRMSPSRFACFVVPAANHRLDNTVSWAFINARYEIGAAVGIGSSGCIRCGAGHFANVPGMPQCELCTAGRFSESVGQQNCELCGIG